MAFTLSVIRTAIYDQLRANLDRETNVSVDGREMPPPVIRFELTSTPDYWETFGVDGMCAVEARLVLDPGGVDESAVKRLDEYLSVGTGNNSSVIDALMADKTFGGAVDALEVRPGAYDADTVTAELLLRFVARKQGATT